MAYDAVLRNLAVIGEAVKALSPDFKADHSTIPWPAIAGLRNVVIHEYFRVNPDLIRNILDEPLTELSSIIQETTSHMRGTMTTEEVLREYYAAYNAGDADRLAAVLDDNVVLRSGTMTQTGRDAYLGMYQFMTGNFEDTITPTSITGDGENGETKFENTLVARNDIPDFMGRAVKAGEMIKLTMSGRYVVRDGKIVDIELS